MARQDTLEASAPNPQQSLSGQHVPGRLRDLLGTRIHGEIYLSTLEAAQYVGRPTREAFIKWARRNGVALRRPDGGRTLSVRKGDLDFALRVRG